MIVRSICAVVLAGKEELGSMRLAEKLDWKGLNFYFPPYYCA
jgi:hypothetical protein